jgi:hypothetical protein
MCLNGDRRGDAIGAIDRVAPATPERLRNLMRKAPSVFGAWLDLTPYRNAARV